MNNTTGLKWKVDVKADILAYLTGGCASFTEVKLYLTAKYELTAEQLSAVLQELRLDNWVTRKGGKYQVR